MNPTRLALGVAAVVALFIAFGQPSSTIPTPATAPNTVIVTAPPSTTSTTTEPSTTTSSSTSTTTTTTLPALLPVDHVCYEWLPLLIETGWPTDPDILATALTIMWRESRCDPLADSGPDHGLFQINRYWCKPSRYTANGWLQDRQLVVDCDSLFDPATNAASALAIWHYSEDKNGDGFLPWTTYSGRP